MIAKLTGKVDSKDVQAAVIDCGGVGYLVQCSSWTLERMGRAGDAASLQVITEVREDAILLYGFADRTERDWFQILTTVQGVGGKVALSLLSTLRPAEIAQAIVIEDKAQLTRADGIGPKLAARLLTELKDKAAAFAVPMAAPGKRGKGGSPASGDAVPGAAPALSDAVSALVNLGYGRAEAFAAVAEAARALGPAAAVQALIPAALKELAK